MLRFDEFLEFARNASIVRADYESRQARLEAMCLIYKEEPSPLLRKWIAVASKRLQIQKQLYDAALATQQLPIEEITIIHNKLKELENG